MPVPGTPTVARVPRPETVNFAPRGPIDSDGDDLLKLSVTPGAILTLLQNRKPIFHLNNKYAAENRRVRHEIKKQLTRKKPPRGVEPRT